MLGSGAGVCRSRVPARAGADGLPGTDSVTALYFLASPGAKHEADQ